MIHLAILAQTTYFIFQEQYQYVYLFIGLSIAVLFVFPNMKSIYLLFVLLVVFLLSLYQNKYEIEESFRRRKFRKKTLSKKRFRKQYKKSQDQLKKGYNQSGRFVKKQSKVTKKQMNKGMNKIKKSMKSGGNDSDTAIKIKEEDPLEPVEPNSKLSLKEQKLLNTTFPSPPN